MAGARIDIEFAGIARRDPACVHEEAVVQQRIARADGEEGGAKALQIGEQRRKLRCALLLFVQPRQKRIAELMDIERAQNQALIAEGARAGRHAEIEDAEHQVRGFERRPPVLIA